MDRVAVLIVTHDSAADLPDALAAVAALEHRPLEVVVVDCASADRSADVAGRVVAGWRGIAARIVRLAENRGFAGGMNAALRASDAPYVLSLNPDACPRSDFVTRLLERLRSPDWRLGAVTGRLVRPAAADGERLLDACGMVLTRTWRHLDRGSGAVDRGQLDRPERVFGATGAATLFARAALDDVRLGDEVFDPLYHSYREDAELAFRLRERGWEIAYEPGAVAVHRRRVVPERRRRLPAAINYHSLKNRYLLRAVHQTGGNFVRTLIPTLARDLMALAYVLLAEHTSLPAYSWLWRHRREIRERRRLVQGRRTVPAAKIDVWFRRQALPWDGGPR